MTKPLQISDKAHIYWKPKYIKKDLNQKKWVHFNQPFPICIIFSQTLRKSRKPTQKSPHFSLSQPQGACSSSLSLSVPALFSLQINPLVFLPFLTHFLSLRKMLVPLSTSECQRLYSCWRKAENCRPLVTLIKLFTTSLLYVTYLFYYI